MKGARSDSLTEIADGAKRYHERAVPNMTPAQRKTVEAVAQQIVDLARTKASPADYLAGVLGGAALETSVSQDAAAKSPVAALLGQLLPAPQTSGIAALAAMAACALFVTADA